MAIKGIVFDLDGTLVDSLSATFDAFNYGLVQAGGKVKTNAEIMQYFGSGEKEIFAKLIGADKAKKAYDAARDYMDSHMGEVPLHEGVEQLLEQIQKSKIPTSIFTGRSWPTTELILKHHGILDQFMTVVASDHVHLPKPSPEGLHLVLSRMNLQPNEILFVGDSAADMIASKAAGAHGVAALWDLLAARDQLELYTPSYWAEHPREILEIFSR